MSNWQTCLHQLFSVIRSKKIFTLICFFVTFVLMIRVLNTWLVTKPTSTYKEEKGMTTDDLPEIVACLEPGFDSKVLEKYGYNRGLDYYTGVMNTGKFVGWNGNIDDNYSVYEIFEESLSFDSRLVTKSKLPVFDQKSNTENFYRCRLKWQLVRDNCERPCLSLRALLISYPLFRGTRRCSKCSLPYIE